MRAQFPALVAADSDDSEHGGYVFAENAGGSQVLSSVALSITSYLLSTNVQMASYALATASERNVSLGTCAAAVLIGAESADDVMIGQSATSLVASIAAMIENRAKWRPDHEIVISDADHETNRGAWTRLSQRLGTKLVHWPVQSTCKQNQYAVTLNPLTLKAIVTPSTKLVAFTACSNLLGAFTDVVKAVEIIRSIAPDAMIVVDCVALAPHRRVQPVKWGVDIGFFSLYKTYGAHVGAMYVSPRIKPQLAPLNHFFLQPGTGAETVNGMYRYQTSSVQYELNHSIAAVADYLVGLGLGKLADRVAVDWNAMFDRPTALPYTVASSASETVARKKMSRNEVEDALDSAFLKIASQESRLMSILIPSLLRYAGQGLRIVGPECYTCATRAPTVAFIIVDPSTGHHRVGTSKAIHTALVHNYKVGAQQGHMYAHRLVESLNVHLQDGVVRLSFVHYNTEDEVTRVVAWLDEVLQNVL